MDDQSEDEIVFFVDRCLGSRLVPDSLRAAGWCAEAHDDHFRPTTPDVEWIRVVAKRGWVILTKDRAIGRKPDERRVLYEEGARIVVLASKAHTTGPEIAAAFTSAAGRITAFSRSHAAPFAAKLVRSLSVERWKSASDPPW